MKKNLKKDPGLVYVQEMNFKSSKSQNAFLGDLSKKLGKDFADQFISVIDNRYSYHHAGGTKDHRRSLNIYTLKNKDLNTAMTVSGLYESDYIRSVCNWIYENKDCMHGEVLDVGCDNGIITCFIASRFPDCKLVGVDIEKPSIEVARQLARQMNLENVEFICSSIQDFDCEKEYDVVFSSRTVIENREHAVVEPDTIGYLATIRSQMLEYKAVFMDYSKTLKEHVKDGGYLIQMERMSDNQLLVGWMLAMNEMGFTLEGSPRENAVNEVGNKNTFSGFRYLKKKSELDDNNIIKSWFSRKVSSARSFKNNYYDQDAQLILEYFHFDQEKGLVMRRSKREPDTNQSYACGWLYMPDKKYIEYTISYNNNDADDYSRYRTLIFGDEEGIRSKVLDAYNKTHENALLHGYVMEEHYFGDGVIEL